MQFIFLIIHYLRDCIFIFDSTGHAQPVFLWSDAQRISDYEYDNYVTFDIYNDENIKSLW